MLSRVLFDLLAALSVLTSLAVASSTSQGGAADGDARRKLVYVRDHGSATAQENGIESKNDENPAPAAVEDSAANVKKGPSHPHEHKIENPHQGSSIVRKKQKPKHDEELSVALPPKALASEEKELAAISSLPDTHQLSMWGSLGRIGRHTWHHNYYVVQPASHASSHDMASKAEFFDWCMFLTVLTVALPVQLGVYQFATKFSTHIIALLMWVVVGIAYGANMFIRRGEHKGVMWATGYVLELVNLAENAFIFQSIAKSFQTPRQDARKAILIVTFCQFIFHSIFYMGLADWLRRLNFLPYVVGVWLVYTGLMVMLRRQGRPEDRVNLQDTSFVRLMRWCLGSRLVPQYDDSSTVIVANKNGGIAVSLLGPVILIFVVLDLCLELDITLTKIEELPNLYLSYTSSVLATFVMPELCFVASRLFQSVWTLQYGVASIVIFFGAQMILSDFYQVPVVADILVMIGMLLVCTCAMLCLTKRAVESSDSSDGEAALPGAPSLHI